MPTIKPLKIIENMNRLLLFLLVYAPFSYAQDKRTSLYRVMHADSLIAHAEAIFYSDPDSSFCYSTRAEDYAVKHHLELQAAKAWHSLAKTEVLRGDIEPALKRLKNAIAVFEKYRQQELLARSYGLMSTAVSKINNHPETIRLLLKSIAIYRQLNDGMGLTSTLVNLANTYTKTREFDKALEALNESKLYTRPGDNQWYYYYINAGIIHREQAHYALAKVQLDSCLSISRRHHMVDAEVTAITEMAELCMAMKNMPGALSYFNEAIAMARDKQLPLEESDALKGLVHCHEMNGDYKSAFACQNRLKVISDSLFNIEKIKNINAIEARLKVSEKEKTIALQKLDMEKNAVEQEKSNRRIALLIAGASFLALILFFTVYVYIKVRKQKREVELQKTRAERLNGLNQKIFAVIAHDFKSPMITLNMLMDLLDKENISREDLSTYSADVRNQVIQSGQILDNLLNWAKTELNMSQQLHLRASPFLIAEEITRELHYMSSRKNIRILNEIPENLLLQIPPDILRIITRNLLSNAIKFSYRDSEVRIGYNDHAVLVADTGAGIQDKSFNELFNGTVKSSLGTFNETGFGLGLYITHELISKFNGSIRVENNYPSGTIFKFTIPLHA